MGAAPVLEIEGLGHSYGGVRAVDGVSLSLHSGEICALLGENGAGKSTLMKAVSGAIVPQEGEILLHGAPLPPGDPGAARNRGVSLIYQELEGIGPLSVAENIVLGREPRRHGLFDAGEAKRIAGALLRDLEDSIDPNAPLERLSVAEQQLVEIAKALSAHARVFIMDEPTSALSQREIERLFSIVRKLAASGTAVLFVTHKLDEVFALADRVVVLRDGRVVAQGKTREFGESDLISAMVGRPLDRQFPQHRRKPGAVVLRVEHLRRAPAVKDVSFTVRAGEIVALAGLVGSGRTEVGRMLFGAEPPEGGTITLEGASVRFRHPAEAIAAGVGWVSEDRKGEGLLLDMGVLENATLPHLGTYARAGTIRRGPERADVQLLVDRLRVRTESLETPVRRLSGGNQQKVAMARWLLRERKLLVCDEPTRGVDVGGRYEIYELLEELAERGVAILLISSDLPEVFGMADRAVVLCEGRRTGEVEISGATQEEVLSLAMGGAS